MRTLNVSISDLDYKKFGIKKDKLSFADMMKIITKAMALKKLEKSRELAKQSGLSEMTMDEISEEIKAVRSNAKGRH